MSVIITKNGRNAKRIDSTSFDYEDNLQKYIDDNPEIIPMYQINEDIRVLVLAREFPTNSGPIDALGIDQNGEIYIIETKLYKNSDKRTVCAQALDYGASLWKSSVDFSDFIYQIDSYISKKEGSTCIDKVKAFYGLETTDEIFEKFKDNLNHGYFKFIVLMDHLDSRLKDLVLFINQNSNFNIYAVEFDYYKYEDMEIIIPKLYGSEVKKSIASAKSEGRRSWDENTFFEDAKNKLSDEQLQALHQLYDFAKQNAEEITWGTGTVCGSFNPKHSKISARSFFTFYSNGTMNINFGYLNDDGQRNKLITIFQENGLAPLIKATDDLAHSYPGLKIDAVVKHKEAIINAWQQFIS